MNPICSYPPGPAIVEHPKIGNHPTGDLELRTTTGISLLHRFNQHAWLYGPYPAAPCPALLPTVQTHTLKIFIPDATNQSGSPETTGVSLLVNFPATAIRIHASSVNGADVIAIFRKHLKMTEEWNLQQVTFVSEKGVVRVFQAAPDSYAESWKRCAAFLELCAGKGWCEVMVVSR